MDWLRKRSLVSQVADWLRTQFLNGTWMGGMQLPSEQELCETLNVSRGTLRTALNILEQEGIIVRRHGVGTFLREQPIIRNNLSLVYGTTDMIRSMGMEPGIAQISLTDIQATVDIASRLKLKPEERVIHVHRVQTADKKNVVVTTDYLPKALLQRYLNGTPTLQTLRHYILEHLSLYHLLESGLGLKINHSTVELRPLNAPEHIANQLGVDPGAAVMYIEQVDFDIGETPLLYSTEYHAGEASIFTVNKQRS